MKPKKPKSLGILERPTFEVKYFDAHKGDIGIEIATDEKRVKLKVNYYFFAKRLADCAREITLRHRDYVRRERRNYLELKKYTGLVPQDGEE